MEVNRSSEVGQRPTTTAHRGRPNAANGLRVALFGLLAVWLLWGGLATGAAAQDTELTLYVRRNFGYGGGSQIQGNFRLEVEGPADLASVTYLIDGDVLATTSAAPFRVDFDTDTYPHGWHELTATGTLRDGRVLVSNTRRFEFVAAEVGWQAAGQMGGTLILGVGAVFALVFVVQAFVFGRSGARRGYGWLGGAICPRCGRAFGIHLWSLNAVGARFDRCDHCGGWSLVRRASPEALAAAEVADAPEAVVAEPDRAGQRERQLEETRYVDEV